jgi:hypothetical protein
VSKIPTDDRVNTQVHAVLLVRLLSYPSDKEEVEAKQGPLKICDKLGENALEPQSSV